MKSFSQILVVTMIVALNACNTSPTTTQASATPTVIQTVRFSSTVLSGFTAPVTLIAWSPDGKILASAAKNESDHTIKLWNANGNSIQTLKGHTDSILCLAWAPDGQTLTSGGVDQSVRFWKRDGTLIKTQTIGKGSVWAVAWSPDGKILATTSMIGYLNPTIQLWDANGNLISTMGTQFTGGKFYNLLWSPDGTRLLGGATDYKVWKNDGSELIHLTSCEHCTPSWAAGWSPDSQSFATGDENGQLAIYDRDGKLLSSYQSPDDINAMAWSPDGKLIAAGRGLLRADGTHLSGVNGRVNSVAWSFDGQYAAFAADNRINILRSDGTHIMTLSDHTDTVNKVMWSPTALMLASASDDETIRLWEMP